MSRLRGAGHTVVRPPEVMEGSVVTVFRVPPESAGMRVDVFLQGQLQRTSRTRAAEIVRHSAYDATGRRLRKSSRVLAEQRVVLWRPPWDETPVPTEIPVLYEDDHLLAVNKPAHLPVHPTARYHKNTLIMLLQAQRPGQWLSLGHRIDRETSGVLLVSKSPECDRALKKSFEARSDIEKTYVAFTWGVPDPGGEPTPPLRSFRCDKSLELDPESRLAVKMRISASETALSAATRFRIEAIARRPEGPGVVHAPAPGPGTYARIVCDLETGRQHQIRVHLASYGTPIVGDKLYGPDERLFARCADGELTEDDLDRLELPRHALHARTLALAHPMTQRPLTIHAPLPDDLDDFWRSLRPVANEVEARSWPLWASG